MKICFVRHTDIKKYITSLIPDSVHISSKGKRKAKEVAKYLENENVVAVYSSPITRAVDTAKIIAKHFNLDYITMKQFTCRLGTTPKNPEEEVWLNNYMNYDYINGKFETLTRFTKQNFDGLDLVIKENKLKETNDFEPTIVIVGHSCNLYAFNAYFNKTSLKGKGVWLQCSMGAVIKWRM